jgi:oxygen-independent coproporphyrinogen-3 oxidase
MSCASAPLGIYVHWPYCARICPYCDFNVYRPRGADPGPLIDAIIADARAHADRVGSRPAATLFLGGGTPSLLAPRDIERLLAGVHRAFPLAPDCEVTLEANPEDHARLADYVRAGVTRLSLGLQSLRAADLAALGRAHDPALGRVAVAAAAASGARVSIDLIYARHGQTQTDWRDELTEALALPVEHLSLYQLTIEQGTAFERAVRRGRIVPPPGEEAAALYDLTQALCEAADAPAYEVSNHARGGAAASRHNCLYWEGADWIGLGPGAHGRISIDGVRTATVAARTPAEYMAACTRSGTGWSETEPLAAGDEADERLMMGLRLVDGVDLAPLESLRGRPFDHEMLATFAAEGLVHLDRTRMRVAPAGRLLTDGIARALCAT